jgi:hypothetical protein
MEEIKTGVFKIKNNIPIYIIGDIHGDYQCLIHCLVDLCEIASIKSIESDNKFNEPVREILEWNGSNSVVVFCGDLIHRKRFKDCVLDDECSDIFIIKTLLRLKKSAILSGGDIIIISGNHEIMNIMDPNNSTYTSEKNLPYNKKYFSQTIFVNEYIANSYAWIKLNDIMIAHGGLCSDYLKFLDESNELKKISNQSNKSNMIGGYSNGYGYGNGYGNTIVGGLEILSNHNIMIGGNLYEFGDDIVAFVNDKYRSFFTDYSESKYQSDPIGFKLFVDYDFSNKHEHNVFWCREWGYSGINCDDFNKTVEKIGCNKMIIAHCPQFLSEDKSKMINFECIDNSTESDINLIKYKIARVDLGMSRCFEYNKHDEFAKFLAYNYNRKMSILKLSWDKKNNNYYFNYDAVITKKISCIQYLLIKYGITKNEWKEKGIESDWLGFNDINDIIEEIKNNKNISKKCNSENNPNDIQSSILCLMYPLYFNKPNLKSTKEFTNLITKKIIK